MGNQSFYSTLSDAINGYVYRFQIYTGKNVDDSVDVGLCSRMCLELMSGLEPGFKLLQNLCLYFSIVQIRI